MFNGALSRVLAADAAQQAAEWVQLDSAAWESAFNDSVVHQCAPIFHDRLRALGLLKHVPEHVQKQLLNSKRATAVKNLRGTRQLLELTRQISGRAPVIALKGACLARTCYLDVSLRPMLDLDLLAKEAELGIVREALGHLGYVQNRRLEGGTLTHHDVPYTKIGSIHIELHRSLLESGDPFSIDYQALWSRATPALEIEGLYYLSVEDQLLHVSLHAGYHHRFDIGLYALVDIAMIARSAALDWQTVVRRAHEWKAERCVFLTLEMARQLLHVAVPVEVMATLRPSGFDDDITRMAVAVMRDKHLRGYDPTAFLAETLAELVFRGGLRAIPGKIGRRFLRKRELRSRWPGSAHDASWFGQIAPLFSGMVKLATHRIDRQRLQVRLNGARLRRWMAIAP